MIEGLLSEECYLFKQDSIPNDWGEFGFASEVETSPCLFLDKTGGIIKTKEGMEISISGMFYLSADEDIDEGDIIIYNGYEYKIIGQGIRTNKDIYSGEEVIKQIAVQKGRIANESTTQIKSRFS